MRADIGPSATPRALRRKRFLPNVPDLRPCHAGFAQFPQCVMICEDRATQARASARPACRSMALCNPPVARVVTIRVRRRTFGDKHTSQECAAVVTPGQARCSRAVAHIKFRVSNDQIRRVRPLELGWPRGTAKARRKRDSGVVGLRCLRRMGPRQSEAQRPGLVWPRTSRREAPRPIFLVRGA